MSKRDTFCRNLLACTRRRSISRAFVGWEVVELIRATKEQQPVSCELCGTHFYLGAWLRNPRINSMIPIGGTCVETILQRQFSDSNPAAFSEKELRKRIADVYRAHQDFVDPGAWVTWIVENAPKRLAQIVARLQFLGVVANETDFLKLVRFHDTKRRFPRTAFFPGEKEGHTPDDLPAFLTIAMFKKLVRRKRPEIVAQRSHSYFAAQVSPFLEQHSEVKNAWKSLTNHGRRTVIALCKLSDLRPRGVGLVCDDALAQMWPRLEGPVMRSKFIWNHNIGLGFLDADGLGGIAGNQNIWLWGTGRYTRSLYNISFWREVTSTKVNALEKLEKLAFASA